MLGKLLEVIIPRPKRGGGKNPENEGGLVEVKEEEKEKGRKMQLV
jgi:hypothetical protein